MSIYFAHGDLALRERRRVNVGAAAIVVGATMLGTSCLATAGTVRASVGMPLQAAIADAKIGASTKAYEEANRAACVPNLTATEVKVVAMTKAYIAAKTGIPSRGGECQLGVSERHKRAQAANKVRHVESSSRATATQSMPKLLASTGDIRLFAKELPSALTLRMTFETYTPSVDIDVNQNGAVDRGVDVAFGVTRDMRFCPQYRLSVNSYTGCGGFPSTARSAFSVRNGLKELVWTIPKSELTSSGDAAWLTLKGYNQATHRWARPVNVTIPFVLGEKSANIRLGMSEAAVIAARGEPSRKEVVPPDSELWHYGNEQVAFTNGKVSYVSQ